MNKKQLVIKILLTILVIVLLMYVGFVAMVMILFNDDWRSIFSLSLVPLVTLTSLLAIWKANKKVLLGAVILTSISLIGTAVTVSYNKYQSSLKIDVTPNINIHEYLPFDDESKIVKLESETKIDGELPVLDGAAAVFPVYSAFVNSVYPETTEIYDGVFEYNNTVEGYKLLAEKKTDIFFGAKPSKEQIEYAESLGTEFVLTPIGYEAFVFFVHRKNPIDNLTTEQIKGIYSGEITNWSEVGGKDEDIVAYQRNKGSGSQSMLIRFMGDTPIMEPQKEQINDLMAGIIEQVADYRSSTESIGFSFRYYVEGIIKNKDIKVLSVDGVKPTVESIQDNSYAIITPLYAVTVADEDNENVSKLLDWILSEEGQYIIEKTGYVPVN